MMNIQEKQGVEFEPEMMTAQWKALKGKSTAALSPAYLGHNSYYTESPEISEASEGGMILRAYENLNNGKLGVFFRAGINRDGEFIIYRAFGNLGAGLYNARNLVVENMKWQPGQQLSFNYRLSFAVGEVTYEMSQGHYCVNF
ncbi:hypothetical protein [Pseudomonas sp. CM27]|uniref:hypothetical protein n=1 Tax=Pseudomonas sp. CM27 TaxID=2738452 RepID=UPI0015540CE8|nr:hypothetical protein [Pseudomonas sp. CM27]NQD77756.1 hypothetical protein [Pseudomonas sp. CM27]